MEEVCRACLSTREDENQLQSIFDQNPEGEDPIYKLLNQVINSLPPIESGDGLPEQICNGCIEKLLFCYKFQQMVLLSHKEMREYYALNPEKLNKKYGGGAVVTKLEVVVDEELSFLPSEGDQQHLLVDDELYDVSNDSDVDYDNSLATPANNDGDESSDNSVDGEDNNCVEDKKLAECEHCEKNFKSKLSLRRHMLTKHSEEFERLKLKKLQDSIKKKQAENYVCPKCGRLFSTKKYLAKHLKRHSKEGEKRTLPCDECDEKFNTILLLSQHKALKHHRNKDKAGQQSLNIILDVERPYMCNYCDKAFKQSWTLKDHLRVHTKEMPFICSECGKAFNSKSNLQQHMFRHSGVKRYECPDCPKKFPCLSDLASHKQVHKKIRNHICQICSAAFGKPYQLKKHLMHHNNTKPHQCEQCDKRFVTANHMRRHLRTHTGEKPYSCSYCTRAFAQSNDLIKHLRTHLGENVYKCELCPKRFRLASTLRDHFTEHKNDDDETRERNRLALLEEEEKLTAKLRNVSESKPSSSILASRKLLSSALDKQKSLSSALAKQKSLSAALAKQMRSLVY